MLLSHEREQNEDEIAFQWGEDKPKRILLVDAGRHLNFLVQGQKSSMNASLFKIPEREIEGSFVMLTIPAFKLLGVRQYISV